MSSRPRTDLGICQWFHYQDYESVTRAVGLLRDLGAQRLRTGISWADFHRPGGPQWYRWQMDQLQDFEVLLSIWHTPPSIAEGGCCAGPPRRLEDFADFVGQMIDQFGHRFHQLELWNEPNNLYKWDFRSYDPGWKKFGEMIRLAAHTARRQGMPTVLGGMIPVDHTWLDLMRQSGALEAVDAVAIHAFPEMWWPNHPSWDWYGNWNGWQDKIDYIASYAQRPIWVTETGLATWDLDRGCEARHELQSTMLERAARAPAERVYWYSLIDLHPARDAIEGFHVDENEYHMGLVTWDGAYKDSYFRMQDLLKLDRRDSRRHDRPQAEGSGRRRPPRVPARTRRG